jgi:hypothetical protein
MAKEEISNAKVFRIDCTIFRRHRSSRGGGGFVCVKNFIACTGLSVEEDVEIISVEVKRMDPKYSREITGNYRAPNEDMWAIGRLVARTQFTRDAAKRIIIGGDLNLPQADWHGDAEKTSCFQAFVNRVVRDNGYIQAARGPTRGDALLEIYLVRPDNLLTSCNLYPASAIISGYY